MYKLKSFIDLDKEEAWLSDMSAKGWFLSRRGSFGGYTFVQADPQRYAYSIDYREFSKNDDYLDYIALFQDAGWLHVAGNRWTGSQYFVPADGNANKRLFSDSASKAARYRRLGQTWLSLFVVYLALFLILTLSPSGGIDLHALLNPAELYYTPGLWEKTGFDFWRAFIFETPFALMRGYGWLAIPVFLGICLYYLLKTRSLGKKTAAATP